MPTPIYVLKVTDEEIQFGIVDHQRPSQLDALFEPRLVRRLFHHDIPVLPPLLTLTEFFAVPRANFLTIVENNHVVRDQRRVVLRSGAAVFADDNTPALD